jgi:multidrug resistance efflux pump
MAQSLEAQSCYVGSWLTYAYGRTETTQDACTRASLERAFAEVGGNVKALLLALTQTDAFLYRPLPSSM